ncbi:MAG: glycosyltransferase family 39 protein, partial [Candidatus Rokuibacteriota bacterium]
GLVVTVGRAWFGAVTGLLAALALLVSQSGAAQIVMVRPDPVFALFVTLGAVAALSAWERGTGWTWCWLAAAMATLTKGPLGLLLMAGGLAAVVWERKRSAPLTLRARHVLGLALFLLITLGWLALAYRELGQALDRMFVTELIGHALPAQGPRQGHRRVSGVLMPSVFFLLTFAPWSLITIAALVRTWWRPAADGDERRRERFLVCWLLTGLVVFSLSPHQDERHLFPLMPPAALLAGRELARVMKGLSPRTVLVRSAIAAAVGLTALGYGYQQMRDRHARGDRTRGMESLARSIRAQVGPASPLVHVVGSPVTLPLFLDQVTPMVSAAEAAPLLRGPRPAFVATRDVAALRSALGPDPPALFEVARWPPTGAAGVVVVRNHPRLEPTDRLATLVDSSLLELDGMRFLGPRWGYLELARVGAPGSAAITNTSAEPRLVRVRIVEGASSTTVDRRLPPGTRWEIGADGRR